MVKNLLVTEEIPSVLPSRPLQGRILATEAFPVHCTAEGGAYWVLFNGALLRIFSHGSLSRSEYSSLVLPTGRDITIQVYTYRGRNASPRHFTALSKPIGYKYSYDALASFLNAFRSGFRRREFQNYKTATEEAYAALEAQARPLLEDGKLMPLTCLSDLIDPIAPFTTVRGLPHFETEVRFNLSYLTLPGQKYCTILEFPSIESILARGWVPPTTALESLICTSVTFPGDWEAERFEKDLLNLTRFVGLVQRKKSSEAKPLATPVVTVRNTLLLLSKDPLRLRMEAEAYIEELHKSFIPANTSILRAKDAFCNAFPGQGRLIKGCLRAHAEVLPFILEAFHA